jgi:transposase
MTTIPTIVTYHSSNNKPEWFAYCKPNGEFLGVRFEGNTEAEAVERAKTWWLNETARQAKLTGKVELDDDEVSSKSYKNDGWGKPAAGWGKASVNEGLNTFAKTSNHGLTGKVWLANRELKEKKRVDPSQVDAMMAQGWFRAGPRTVL